MGDYVLRFSAPCMISCEWIGVAGFKTNSAIFYQLYFREERLLQCCFLNMYLKRDFVLFNSLYDCHL